MERYDYYKAVEHDVLDYIQENLESSDWLDNQDGLEKHLNDVLWQEDSVTGNASGSYWCNAWRAEEALCHNAGLLRESMDVSIRCYVLDVAVRQALDRLENNGWFDRPSVINTHYQVIPVNVAIQLMDDDLREKLHRELAPCTEQDFFDAYCGAHQARFSEVWELDKPNPCY